MQERGLDPKPYFEAGTGPTTQQYTDYQQPAPPPTELQLLQQKMNREKAEREAAPPPLTQEGAEQAFAAPEGGGFQGLLDYVAPPSIATPPSPTQPIDPLTGDPLPQKGADLATGGVSGPAGYQDLLNYVDPPSITTVADTTPDPVADTTTDPVAVFKPTDPVADTTTVTDPTTATGPITVTDPIAGRKPARNPSQPRGASSNRWRCGARWGYFGNGSAIR